MTLATDYRPHTFEDLCEQKSIVNILEYQIENECPKNAYLFTGPAGCGKTTSARILANALNKGKGQPIERDAARHNGVDKIRVIIDEAGFQSLDSKYKIFIIDECFKPGTLVATPEGSKCIEDIKEGDQILNCQGVSTVAHVHKNRVLTSRLCNVIINGVSTVTTVDHLFLTQDGWVTAQNLKKGDIVYGRSNLQELWKRVCEQSFRCKNLFQGMPEGVMFEECSETDKNRITNLCNMWQALSMQTPREEEDLFQGMSKFVDFKDGKITSTDFKRSATEITEFFKNAKEQSNVKPRNFREGEEYKNNERDLSPTSSYKGWEWSFYETSNDVEGEVAELDIRVCNTNKDEKELSYLLQSRPRLTFDEIGDRGGWCRPSLEKAIISGCKENSTFEEFRVDRVEIYQPGNSGEFTRSFGKDSKYTTMYDLEIQGHPSYFANGILVHNCHMITTEGWNAMLKILEEPPKNTIFIFCTTDPQKIPATILSRVQRFDFQRITLETIIKRLNYILEKEGIKNYTQDAVEFVARMANGGMRDAISLMEKCIDFSPEINIDTVVQALGFIDYDILYNIVLALKEKNVADLISNIEEVYMAGVEIKFLVKQLLSFVLDVCTYSNLRNFKYVNIPVEFEDKLNFLTDNCTSSPRELLKDLVELDGKLRYETNPKLLVESTMVVLCN